MKTFETEETFSWNDLVSTLGPILIDEAKEQELKNKLAEMFANRYRDKNRVLAFSVHPRDEDFQRIKLQLRALGIIRELKGRIGTSWTLTKHGDHVMTQVAAIRSSATH